LHLVGYLCYLQMGFNSVFKGLSILNVGCGTWKVVDAFEFCHSCRHWPPLWTEDNATVYWRQVMALFWCTILRVFMTDLTSGVL
jgi:hypothetical protein